MHHNGGMCTEWASSIHLPFVVGDVALVRSTFECKVYRSPPICFVLCHARIFYIHSISTKMLMVCIHLCMQNHPVSNGICCESLDMTYQCVANDVLRTPTVTNSTIVLVASKQLLAD